MLRRKFRTLRSTGDALLAKKNTLGVIDSVKRIGRSHWILGNLIFLCAGCAAPRKYEKSEVYFADETICHPYRVPIECADGHCVPNAGREVDCEIRRSK